MANIHPSAIVDADAQLAPDVTVGPNCVIGRGVCIDSGTLLSANVIIEANVTIGKNNRFFPNTVIGATPQMLDWDQAREAGRVVIGHGNAFREQVTVHASMQPSGVTTIGSNNLFMVAVHIGHDCTLGDSIVLTNTVQIGGHCKLEDGVWIGGLVGVHQFATVGKWCFVSGHTSIVCDVPPFMVVSGSYPTKIRGVNMRGLKRAGLDTQQQKAVCAAHRHLYRKRQGALLSRARELAEQGGLDENVQAIVDSIERSSKHRLGRHLETLRS
jgi:UDP-N-acetylglucosamine acyltransferase